ncbi:hypothetical protein GYB29_01225 [bacterium]|nr:hypothetical protein [bacterium]
MKSAQFIAFILTFSFLGCSSHLKSSCSDYFRSCEKPKTDLKCDKMISKNLSWVPDLTRLEGPINMAEIVRFKSSDLAAQYFITESKGAESYWWYVDGNKKNGTQGILAVKNCTILTQQSLEMWILDDIAMLYNKRFKSDSPNARGRLVRNFNNFNTTCRLNAGSLYCK